MQIALMRGHAARTLPPMPAIRDACRNDGDDTLLAVRVQPGAAIEGPADVTVRPSAHGGAARTCVRWRVRARAVDGRANAAVVRSVADHLGISPGDVEIVRGARGREKLLRVHGQPVAVVAASLDRQVPGR